MFIGDINNIFDVKYISFLPFFEKLRFPSVFRFDTKGSNNRLKGVNVAGLKLKDNKRKI